MIGSILTGRHESSWVGEALNDSIADKVQSVKVLNSNLFNGQVRK